MRDTQRGTRRPSSTTYSRRSAASTAALACLAVAALALFTSGTLGQSNARTPSGAVQAPAMGSDYLSVRAAIAPVTISAGARIAMTVDITPRPGMHVYAPGSQYRAVTL